jgi:integrase
MQSLDVEGSRKVIEATRETALGLIVYMALHTGARVGELLALRWSDLDLDREAGFDHALGAATQRAGARLLQHKTHGSRRAVALSDACITRLVQHRTEQQEVKARLSEVYDDGNLIFAQALGQPFAPGQVSRGFQLLPKRAGLPTMRFHDLRHTSATLLLT